MAAVIIMMTLLVVLLSGLTAGLGRDSTSAVIDLPADHIVFSAPAAGQGISFTESTVNQHQADALRALPGVTRADLLGIATTKAVSGARTAALSAFGTVPGSRLAPGGRPVDLGQIVLSEGAAESLGAGVGSAVSLAGASLRVAAVAGDDAYSHTPVVWVSLADWRRLAPGGTPHQATVIALTTTSASGLAGADHRLGTRTVTRAGSLAAIGSHTAESRSLALMRGFLFAISALVVGSFFTVWTIQRSGDVAVLKALGASTAYLLRDALGQALVLLLGGTAIGSGLAVVAGFAASGTVPFVLGPATVLFPAAILIVLGSIGAALSIRRITSVDPLIALGSAR